MSDLDMDRDWKSLYRINNYLYQEWRRENRKPLRRLWNWKAARRHHRLGVTVDVMHELAKELRAQGQLTAPVETMFSPDETDHPEVSRR